MRSSERYSGGVGEPGESAAMRSLYFDWDSVLQCVPGAQFVDTVSDRKVPIDLMIFPFFNWKRGHRLDGDCRRLGCEIGICLGSCIILFNLRTRVSPNESLLHHVILIFDSKEERGKLYSN